VCPKSLLRTDWTRTPTLRVVIGAQNPVVAVAVSGES